MAALPGERALPTLGIEYPLALDLKAASPIQNRPTKLWFI